MKHLDIFWTKGANRVKIAKGFRNFIFRDIIKGEVTMEYIGLTEEELLDVVIEAESDMGAAKARYDNKLRDLGIREEEIQKRLRHFESTFLTRRLIAENNRRIAEGMGKDFDITKKDLFI